MQVGVPGALFGGWIQPRLGFLCGLPISAAGKVWGRSVLDVPVSRATKLTRPSLARV